MQQTQSFHPKRIVKFPSSKCSAFVQESDFSFVIPQVFMLWRVFFLKKFVYFEAIPMVSLIAQHTLT